MFCLLAGDVSAGTYLSSSHGGRNGAVGAGVDRVSLPASYAKGNCAHCHEQHAWIGGSEPAPANGPAKWLLLDKLDSTSAGNAACDYCHNGSVPPLAKNIAAQIAKAYKHNPFSLKVTSPATLVCIDCHESHTAQDVDHTSVAATNLIGTNSPLLGVAGNSYTFTAPAPPVPGAESMPTTNQGAALNQITYEYELCFKCHAGFNLNITATDVAPQFDLANYSAHPVYGTNLSNWKNLFLAGNPAALNARWTANARMFCSDCHGSETAGDPEGPHGSTQQYLLKYPGPVAGVLDNLCLSCHNVLALSGFVDPVGGSPHVNPNGAINGDHNLPQHQYPANAAGCLACHGGFGSPVLVSNIHGANYQWPAFGGDPGRPSKEFLLPSYVGGGPVFYITSNTYNVTVPPLLGDVRGNRLCAASCHAGGVAYWY